MSTRTKEEELALDEKIARIQRKNEEILRRQKEIEEDKRMAEQQNAIVKLRPSTTNISRERTPALKPSNRELRHDTSEDFSEPPPMQRSARGSFRGRGGERLRGQGDWKSGGGPPPDPRSFLYDDERDGPTGEGSEQRREPERREERDTRGGREFQRGRRRGGMEYSRGERGRRGGGGGRGRREEEEWRAERMKIDEARIRRQRAADGRWRREWDNEKTLQEPLEEPRHEARKLHSPNQEKWSPPSQHRGQFHTSPDRGPRQSGRGGGLTPRGGRGRGRLDPAELEMPLDNFPIEVLQSPRQKSRQEFIVEDNFRRHPPVEVVASPPSPHPPPEDFMLDPTRSVACVGNSVKISIPNTGAAQTTPKPQRQAREQRGRFKSQTSYSSQSDDDTPRDRSHRGGRRQRNQKATKGQEKNQSEAKTLAANKTTAKLSSESDQTPDKTGLETLPVQNKPPLPPFRAEQKPTVEVKEPLEAKDGDESWEDVTTSGTESMGEDFSSIHSSPLKRTIVNTMISGNQSELSTMGAVQSLEFAQKQPIESLEFTKNQPIESLEFTKNQLIESLEFTKNQPIESLDFSLNQPIESLEFIKNQPIDEDVKNSYEEYLREMEMNELKKKLEDVSLNQHEALEQNLEESSANISLDTSGNIFLHENIAEETVDQQKSLTTLSDSGECLDAETKTDNLREKEINTKDETPSKLMEDNGTTPAQNLESKGKNQCKENYVEKEVKTETNEIINEQPTEHKENEPVGEAQIKLSEDKDVSAISVDSNKTETVNTEGKETKPSEAEVVK